MQNYTEIEKLVMRAEDSGIPDLPLHCDWVAKTPDNSLVCLLNDGAGLNMFELRGDTSREKQEYLAILIHDATMHLDEEPAGSELDRYQSMVSDIGYVLVMLE